MQVASVGIIWIALLLLLVIFAYWGFIAVLMGIENRELNILYSKNDIDSL